MNLYIWRHPKPLVAAGICLGCNDMGVNRRKLKRLVNQIQRFVRVQQLPKVIWVSSLQRPLQVGEILKQCGFQCPVAHELVELDFGAWNGQPWAQIAKQEIDEWCNNFAHFAPDNGESVQQLFTRVAGWLNARVAAQNSSVIDVPTGTSILAVGHVGWINAAKMIDAGQDVPQVASDWPRPVAYRELSMLKLSEF